MGTGHTNHSRRGGGFALAISYAQPGDVLVVSSGDQPAGRFGDVSANACAARGIAALVTDGGVRDTREIRELGFPVFAQYICIHGTVKGLAVAAQQHNATRLLGGEEPLNRIDLKEFC